MQQSHSLGHYSVVEVHVGRRPGLQHLSALLYVVQLVSALTRIIVGYSRFTLLCGCMWALKGLMLRIIVANFFSWWHFWVGRRSAVVGWVKFRVFILVLMSKFVWAGLFLWSVLRNIVLSLGLMAYPWVDSACTIVNADALEFPLDFSYDHLIFSFLLSQQV